MFPRYVVLRILFLFNLESVLYKKIFSSVNKKSELLNIVELNSIMLFLLIKNAKKEQTTIIPRVLIIITPCSDTQPN